MLSQALAQSYGGHYVPAFAYKIHQANQGGKQAQQQQRAKHAPQWPAGSVGDVAQTGGVVINMKGVSIGDGWVDPLRKSHAAVNSCRHSPLGSTQHAPKLLLSPDMVPAYADQMYNVGMADANQAAIIRGYTQRIVAAIESGDRLAAFHVWDEMINGVDDSQTTAASCVLALTSLTPMLSAQVMCTPTPTTFTTSLAPMSASLCALPSCTHM